MASSRSVTAPLIGLFVFGCAASDTGGPGSSGECYLPGDKDCAPDTGGGKGDEWDYRNDPQRVAQNLEYRIDELPLEGRTERSMWAASYWPTYKGSSNYRWQGDSTLSPLEKYDRAFNDWEPTDEYLTDVPKDCGDDAHEQYPQYIDWLGPAAEWQANYQSRPKMFNGRNDDADEDDEIDECYEVVDTWWGLCHAWAPAAILEPEPLQGVEYNGERFEVSDIKALLITIYDDTKSVGVGGRCNAMDIDRDETGRVTANECRDTNAGTWHVVTTNLLGINDRPFVMDRVAGFEVWNQPVFGYEVTHLEEISLAQANELLDVPTEEVHTAESDANLQIEDDAVSESTLHIDQEIGFEQVKVDTSITHPERQELTLELEHAGTTVTLYDQESSGEDLSQTWTLDEFAGAPAGGDWTLRIRDNRSGNTGTLNGFALTFVAERESYPYNPRAESFYEVRMRADWLTEGHQSTEPLGHDRYMRTDRYHYILEVDGSGKIIGGEWVGRSRDNHPDFLWVPERATAESSYGYSRSNPHVNLEKVRTLLELSRQDEDDDEGGGGHEEGDTYTNDTETPIPDNDPDGTQSVITVDDDFEVDQVSVSVDIAHTWRGDLRVVLEHAGESVVLHDRDGGSADDLTHTWSLSEFQGTSARGEWVLRVSDHARIDTGSINKFSITFVQ